MGPTIRRGGRAAAAALALAAAGAGPARGADAPLPPENTAPRPSSVWSNPLAELGRRLERELDELRKSRGQLMSAESGLLAAGKTAARSAAGSSAAEDYARGAADSKVAAPVAADASGKSAGALLGLERKLEETRRGIRRADDLIARGEKQRGALADLPGRDQLPKNGHALFRAVAGQVHFEYPAGVSPEKPGDVPPGTRIRTGPGASFLLFMEDESGRVTGILVGPNTESFTYDGPEKSPTLFHLLKGRLHYLRACAYRDTERCRLLKEQETPPKFESGGGIGTIGGTEFDLYREGTGSAHLRPYSGSIEMAAGAAERELPAEQRWWDGDAEPAPAPSAAEAALLRVESVRGKAWIEGPGGRREAAGPGATLDRGEALRTEAGARVRASVKDGYRLWLDGASRLEASTQGASDAPLYALWEGRLHAEGGGAEESPKFLVPNAVLSPEKADFDL
ncbi:MAG TPA: hypothetical protein VNI01_14105, partial [Elusimicrobiota bacterium]|nr:hypothetical protein [Elusimicrobiota bacterium]